MNSFFLLKLKKLFNSFSDQYKIKTTPFFSTNKDIFLYIMKEELRFEIARRFETSNVNFKDIQNSKIFLKNKIRINSIKIENFLKKRKPINLLIRKGIYIENKLNFNEIKEFLEKNYRIKKISDEFFCVSVSQNIVGMGKRADYLLKKKILKSKLCENFEDLNIN